MISFAFGDLRRSIVAAGVAFSLSCGYPMHAQEHASSQLRILVVDSTRAAVRGATIDVAGAPGRSTSSKANGEADLSLPAGRYVLTVTAPGFGTAREDVRIVGTETQFLTVMLHVGNADQSVEVDADGFVATQASSAAKIPMRLLDTPQQTEVFTRELLQSRGTESMKHAVEMAPAVGLQLGEGRRDNFFIRGFNAVGDMYIDGVRDDAQYYRDLSNTDHIEVLEGPAAVLYGRGSSGGLINRVSKKPRLDGTLGELGYTEGSYGEHRGDADLDTVVPGTGRKVGFRLTGAAEAEGSQRHFYWENHYTFAPTLTWKPSDATSITAQVERLRDDRLPDRGIPYIPAGLGRGAGGPVQVPVGNYYGYVGPLPGSNFIHSSVADGTLTVQHTFTSGWELHATQRSAGYMANFANMYATSVTRGADGRLVVGRGEYNGTQEWQLAYTNVEAYGTRSWLGMAHTFLLGAEYGREATDCTQYNGPTNQTPVDLLNPANVAPVLSTLLSRNNRFLGQTNAFYAQDLAQVSSRIKVLAGVRVDSFRQTLELRPPTNTTPNLERTDYAASPRIGIVYSVRPSISTYANYSRTFDPSGENLSLAITNAQLKPEVTQNYEAGAKTELLHSRLLVTSSVFRLDRTNIKTTDPNDPTALLNLGEQRTDGAELNVQGSLARGWQVYAGYAWLDARIVSSTTTSNGVLLQGRRPAMTPLHGASVWTTYNFDDRFHPLHMNLHGFAMGGGVIAKDIQFASTDNLAKLPGYARLDLMAAYRRPHYEIQANVQNAGNIRYYDAAQSDFQIYPSAPVNASLSVRWRFWGVR